MEELAKSVFSAPIATLFVVAGMIFLLIAVVGKFSGKIDPGNTGRIAAGVFGLAFVLIGLSMHLFNDARQTSSNRQTSNEDTETTPTTAIPGTTETPDTQLTDAKTNATAISAEVEPNDTTAARNIVVEGAKIRGGLAKSSDRDYFEFKATSGKTRFVLRKDFDALLQVYDSAELKIVNYSIGGLNTISEVAETAPNSVYVVLVQSNCCDAKGRYELIISPE